MHISQTSERFFCENASKVMLSGQGRWKVDNWGPDIHMFVFLKPFFSVRRRIYEYLPPPPNY